MNLQIDDRVHVRGIGFGVITHVYSSYYEVTLDTPINGHKILNCDPSGVTKELQKE